MAMNSALEEHSPASPQFEQSGCLSVQMPPNSKTVKASMAMAQRGSRGSRGGYPLAALGRYNEEGTAVADFDEGSSVSMSLRRGADGTRSKAVAEMWTADADFA